MLHWKILHPLVLLSLLCLANAVEDDNQCVSVKVTDRCAASELDTGFNVVSWANGVNKCDGAEECCSRSKDVTREAAKKGWNSCMASCKTICNTAGSNGHLYTATWPVICKQSCDELRIALYYGLFGADCPTKDEPCLADFTLDFGKPDGSDVPEVEVCRKDPKSCSVCLINKTLPNYSDKVPLCQSSCSESKPKLKLFGAKAMSAKALCSAHLYGQYIKFIQRSCSEPEKDECTPDGGTGLIGGSCSTSNCQTEKAKCLTDSAPMIRRVAEMVANKWKQSCEESCETASGASYEECVAKGKDRQDEVESTLMGTVCSFLEVRS